jgi:hypothetical protein
VSTTVLVTGPTGKVGRRLIPVLVRRGITVRTASRSALPERAGIESVPFDWADESTYETARKGVDAMHLVAGPVPQAEHAGYIRTLLDGVAGAGSNRSSCCPRTAWTRRRRRTRYAKSSWQIRRDGPHTHARHAPRRGRAT